MNRQRRWMRLGTAVLVLWIGDATMGGSCARAQALPPGMVSLNAQQSQQSAQAFEAYVRRTLPEQQRRTLRVQSAQVSPAIPGLTSLRIEAIDPRGPGSAIGLQPGELILSYDGRNLSSAPAFVQAVQATAARTTPVNITVLGLDGRERTLQIPPGRVGVQVRPAVWSELPESDRNPVVFVQSGQDQLRTLAMDREGRRALTSDLRGGVRVWDLAGQRLLTQWQAHPSYATEAVLSPSGRLALTVGTDALRVWDATSGAKLWEWPGGLLWQVAFEADDRHFWVHQGERLVRWDLRTQLSVDELPLGIKGAWPVQLALSPDGRQLLALTKSLAEGGVVKLSVADLTQGRVRTWSDPAHPGLSDAVWSPAGDQIVLGTEAGRVGQLQVATWQTHWLPAEQTDKVDGLRMSADGRQLLRVGAWRLTRHELPSGRLLNTLDDGREVTRDGKAHRFRRVADATFAPGEDRLLVAPGHYYAETWADPRVRDLGNPTLEFWSAGQGARPGSFPRALQGYVSTIDDSGTRTARMVKDELQLWDIRSGRLNGAWKLPEPLAVGALAFAAGGQQVLAGAIRVQPGMSGYDTAGAVLLRFDAATGRVLQQVPVGQGLPTGLAQSADGQRIAVSFAGSARIALLDGQGRVLTTLDARGVLDRLRGAVVASGFSLIKTMRFSPDGRQLLAMDLGTGASVLWDVAAGRTLQEFPGGASNGGDFLPDGRVLVGGSNALVSLQPGQEATRQLWWQATGGPLSNSEEDNPVEQLRVSLQGDRVALVRNGRVEIWSVAARQRSQVLRSGPVQAVAFSAGGEQLYTTHDDGTIRLWSLRSGQETLRLLQTPSGDGIAMTRRGYFSASNPRAAEHVTVRVGAELYALGQLFETFYRPDIVAATLAGQDGPELGSASLAEVLRDAPPQVSELAATGPTTGARVTVRYRVQAGAGGLGDVRIYQNGKLVRWVRRSAGSLPALVPGQPAAGAGGARSLASVTEEAWSRQLRTLAVRPAADKPLPATTTAAAGDEGSLEITPVPGSNEISVVAFNAGNTVASAPRQLVFSSKMAPQPPTLHVLAIGIDAYADPGARLKYAAKDASDMVTRFEREATSLYGPGRVQVERLLDKDATRARVLERLDALARRARPSDHVLVFAAAHGVMANGGYQLVTVEYDGKLGPGNTISADEIVERSQRIPALSQWLVFDTCHAGGLGTLLNGLYDARVQVLARQSGMHVFAAASTTQEALDGHEGNGLFTYTLLQGIGPGLGADRDGDRGVSITELGRYARERTRALAAERSHQQDPLIVHHGEDRVVARQR